MATPTEQEVFDMLDELNIPSMTQPTSGGFDLGGTIGGLLSGITSNLGTIGSGIGGMAAINAAYDRLGNVGERALTGANLIAGQGLEQTQFKPFTVTTGMGDQIGITEGGLDIDLGRGRDVSNQFLSTASRKLDEMGPGTAATDVAMQQAFGVGSDFMGRLGQTERNVSKKYLIGFELHNWGRRASTTGAGGASSQSRQARR